MNKIFQILEGQGLKDIYLVKKKKNVVHKYYNIQGAMRNKHFILLKPGKRRKQRERKIIIEIKNSKRMTSPRR